MPYNIDRTVREGEMSLFVSFDRELMRESFARAVERRLPERGMTLSELSEQMGLSEEKLTGQDEIFLPELRAVTKILWGKEPSEVDELWPKDLTGHIEGGRLIMMAAELGIPLYQLTRGDASV